MRLPVLLPGRRHRLPAEAGHAPAGAAPTALLGAPQLPQPRQGRHEQAPAPVPPAPAAVSGFPGRAGAHVPPPQPPAFPYPAEAGLRQRIGPSVHLKPAAVTRPMPAVPGAVPAVAVDLPESGPVLVASTDPATAAELLAALQGGIHWPSVDAAREQEGLTYAGARRAADPLTAPGWPATGPEKLHDAVLFAARPSQRPPFAEAARRRISALAYPSFSLPAGLYAAAEAEFLRRVSVITGTAGAGSQPPAAAAGGAR
jgi:hypothetical protein